MSLTKALTVLALLPGCLGGAGSECGEQTGPGVSGMVRYTTGDGASLEATLDSAYVRMTDADAIVLAGTLDDEWGRPRGYRIELHALGPGMLDLAGHGSLCMPRQTGGDDVCSAVTGTIEVRRLDSECYTHESGISSCIFTIDLTLHATSGWQDTMFEIDAEELTVGEWAPCDL